MQRSMVRKRERRSHLRFNSAESGIAQISFDEKFKSTVAGLICNESYSGCSLLILKDERIVDGAKCYVKCGQLAAMEAAIRWINELDDKSIRVGIEFLSK